MMKADKQEKLMCIDDAIHTAIMTARIIVEEGEGTKDEMQEYLVNKCNEELHAVFSAPKKVFAFMALKDLLECMSTLEVADFVEEMNNEEI